MAMVAGVLGSVTFSAGYVTKTRSWTLSVEADELDVTSWDDYAGASDLSEWDVYIGGRKRWSGTFTALQDSGSGEDVMPLTLPLGDENAAATATFSVDGTAQWSGDIIITGIESTQTIDGVAEVSYTFRGSGQLTYTDAA